MIHLDLESPTLGGGTGAGVRIAIVDSGAVAGHPHLPTVAGGVSIFGDALDQDYRDRIGHGTAVAAAIYEKASGAELFVARVFHDRLVADAYSLARAIEWSVEQGAHLINLSLGTPNLEHEQALTEAVASATRGGALVIAALEGDGVPMLPGALDGVVAVVADASISRRAIVVSREGGKLRVAASPFPRPIPGVPHERNLSGVSFAVANATGVLARAMEVASAIPELEGLFPERLLPPADGPDGHSPARLEAHP